VRLGPAAEVPPSAASTAQLPALGADPPSSKREPWDIVLKFPDSGTTFDELEKEILSQVLTRADGNQSRAARSLGLSESTLRSRLKRLGLKGPA
jgi:transcriptional regulator with GAF, ATPase, and Fis domain